MIRIYGGFGRYLCHMLKKPRGSRTSILSLFLVRSGCPPCFSDLAIVTRSVDRVQCGSSVPSVCRRRAERAWGESPLSGTKKTPPPRFFYAFFTKPSERAQIAFFQMRGRGSLLVVNDRSPRHEERALDAPFHTVWRLLRDSNPRKEQSDGIAIATRSVDRVQCGSSVASACRRRAERAWGGKSPLRHKKNTSSEVFFGAC